MDENTLCPICKDICIFPRIYENCGHTVCEKCMKNMDKTEKEKITSPFIVPIFKCPICRTESLYPWHKRQKNHKLISLLESSEKYKEIVKKYKQEYSKTEKQTVDKNINFSFLTEKIQKKKAKELYNYILPIIYQEILKGISKIIIKYKNKELIKFSDKISELLFANGIYKVTARTNEFIVDVLPSNGNYINEYKNSNFDSENEYINIEQIENSDDSIY